MTRLPPPLHGRAHQAARGPAAPARGRRTIPRRPRACRACSSSSFVRSPHAHARHRPRSTPRPRPRACPAWWPSSPPTSCAPCEAAGAPVEGGGFTATAWPMLADGDARFCGEAVAAIVAESRLRGGRRARADLRRVEAEPRRREHRPALLASGRDPVPSDATGRATSTARSPAPRSSIRETFEPRPVRARHRWSRGDARRLGR